MVASVLVVFALAYIDLDRENSRALDDFSADQLSLATAKADAVEARLNSVVEDLHSAAELGDDAALERVLQTFITDGALIRQADIIGGDGRPILSVTAPGVPLLRESASLEHARTATSRAAGGTGVWVSEQIRSADGSEDRLRLFATASGQGFIAFLVDSEVLFEGLAVSNGEPAPLRVIVRDHSGNWTDIGERDDVGARASWTDVASAAPYDVSSLLNRMAGGEHGTSSVGREAAVWLGLDPRLAVTGFAPVRIPHGPQWSLAVVASAMRIRDRARVGRWRLAATTALATLIVAAFGVVVRRQQRRALELSQALRLAADTAALRERSEKIVDTIPVGLLAVDRQLRVTSVNPYLMERGLRTGGSLEDTLTSATPHERASVTELVQRALQSQTTEVSTDLALHLATQARDVDVYAVPLERPLPDANCFLVIHDRTEIRRLERDLARAGKLATIGTLASGVAHELGTPLGIISGRAEQLLARVATDEVSEPSRKALSSILTQVEKVSKTIRQLLDFARVRPIEAIALDSGQLLHSAAALLEYRFRQSTVTVSIDVPAALPKISGDIGQLEQVFVNLMMNAVDACQPGGRVRASAHAEADAIVLVVEDNGCGIATEDLDAVFDPFFTTKKRGQGTGLGLSIAADIIRNHGGSMRIDSMIGSGTSVSVTLPVAEA